MTTSQDSWKEKVHPLFIEGAGIFRDAIKANLALGKNPPADKVAELIERFEKKLEVVRRRHADAQYSPTTNDPLDMIFVDARSYSCQPSEREIAEGLLQILYWNRFKEPLWIALQKVNKGDVAALRRVNRVTEDYQRLHFGKGPIKPAKGDPDHAFLLEFSLDMGLSALTAEELADCFDAVCACGKTHDADGLKKQRYRKQKELQEARDWFAAERAKMPSREWMVAYGIDGLCAKGFLSPNDSSRLVFVWRIGQAATCYIDEQGALTVVEGSEFATNPAVVEQLPAAFLVGSTRELFNMFFPEEPQDIKTK